MLPSVDLPGIRLCGVARFISQVEGQDAITAGGEVEVVATMPMYRSGTQWLLHSWNIATSAIAPTQWDAALPLLLP
jgi:hypothetical protein